MPIPNPNDAESTVTVIVPMYNEEESIEILIDKILSLQQRLSTRFEVEYCLVDDGSTDRTWELMPSITPPGATCICRRHSTNRGIGAAMRTGIQAASGSVVCTIDADCSYPPEDLHTLIELVISGATDVAVASPYHPQGRVFGVKPWRILLSRQCSRLYRLCSGLKLHTYTSIFRAYRGVVARRLEFRSDGFVAAVEMLLCADRLGYRICDVPLVLRARQRGYSKIRILRTIWAHVGLLLSQVRFEAGGHWSVGRRPITAHPGDVLGKSAIPISVALGKEDNSIG